MVYADVDQWTLNSLAGTTFPLLRDTRAPDFTIVPGSGGVYITAQPNAPDPWTPPPGSTAHELIPLPGNGLLTLDAFAPDAVQRISRSIPCR